jgi:acyl-CoA thioester hydrolase
VRSPAPAPRDESAVSTIIHRVGFHETDAMGVVHHSNYLRFCEQARVQWLEEHDEPYTDYMALGLHFAVTRVELDYHRSAKFDDRLEIATWVEIVRGASLRMGYRISCKGEVLVTGATEHAVVDDTGRVRRIPKERRENIRRKLAQPGLALET